MEEQSFGLEVTEAARKEIVRVGFDPVFGARPLRRAIQKLIENPISELIIAQKVKEGEAILVDFDGENFSFIMAQAELNPTREEKGKSFTCQYCQNKFETMVLEGQSTVICPKCGKGQREKSKVEKDVGDGHARPVRNETLPEKTAKDNFQPQLATL